MSLHTWFSFFLLAFSLLPFYQGHILGSPISVFMFSPQVSLLSFITSINICILMSLFFCMSINPFSKYLHLDVQWNLIYYISKMEYLIPNTQICSLQSIPISIFILLLRKSTQVEIIIHFCLFLTSYVQFIRQVFLDSAISIQPIRPQLSISTATALKQVALYVSSLLIKILPQFLPLESILSWMERGED